MTWQMLSKKIHISCNSEFILLLTFDKDKVNKSARMDSALI